jgi:subtilisin family serine protease
VFAAPSFLSAYRREQPPSVRPEEWHLRSRGGLSFGEDIRVAAAWKRTLGERGIVVAVLDDGVDLEHPNLRPNLWSNPDPKALDRMGRDFSADLDEPGHLDPRPKCFGDVHGTPCAGLIAAAGLKGGSVGVAPGCRVLPVKIFRGDDLACDEGVANAIRYAALHADVLSCSWSGGLSPDVSQALEDAGTLGRHGLGAAVFCSAGNRYGAPVAFPASDPSSVAVGASTDLGIAADYSSRGPEISVAAPSSGGLRQIFTTDVSLPGRGYSPGDLHTNDFGGTSAATAIAAGVAALVLSVHPGLGRCELSGLLEETAEKIGGGYNALGHSLALGYGRVDAERAVEEAARRVSGSLECSGRAYSTTPLSCSRPLRSS